ncbi:aspartate racemase [candidate division TA06 bacterium]|uniref:Aspartate racemase n=1 Tax=candidate division TA06 bacterium TaxID=2250710 RepID=A0A660S8D0_UNCT6|nr:MAG: aspartate racemase [candidate division TA06 bacterium]
MKTIGIVGGMTWHSSLHYYSVINEIIEEKVGKKHSAKIILYSFDFNEIFEKQFAGEWDYIGKRMEEAAVKLKEAGADFILYASATIHRAIDGIKVDIPILDIRDTVGEEIKKNNVTKVGLLGTSFSMLDNFFKGRLEKKYGIKTIVPSPEKIEIMNRIIFDELACGKVTRESKVQFDKIVRGLELNGAEGIILGCTELHMLITEESPNRFYDTMKIHAYHAAMKSLENNDG